MKVKVKIKLLAPTVAGHLNPLFPNDKGLSKLFDKD
jgi:hypothetical protein